jgi:hypothetical protein
VLRSFHQGKNSRRNRPVAQTTKGSNDMNVQASQTESLGNPEKRLVKRRIDAVGWGLLLILTGGVFLMPDEHLAGVAWLIGVGLVLLSVAAVRHLNGLGPGTANLVLGSVALAGGLAGLFGLSLPLLPILLILFGVCLLISPLLEKEPYASR